MRIKKQAFWIIFVFLLLYPTTVYAGVGDTVAKAITYVLKLMLEPIFDGMLDALNYVLASPTRLHDYPYIETIKNGMQVLAASLLATNLVFRGITYMTDINTGQDVPMAEVLVKTLMAGTLIVALPWILEYILLRANEYLMDWIASLGVTVQFHWTIIWDVSLHIVLILFVWLISLVFLLVVNAIRVAEIIVLYLIAPLIAVSHAGKGEALQNWITNAIAVVFTQSVQYTLVGLSFNLMADFGGEWWTYLGSIGMIVLAIRGPQVLKQYLYSSGVASSTMNVTKMVLYRAVRR